MNNDRAAIVFNVDNAFALVPVRILDIYMCETAVVFYVITSEIGRVNIDRGRPCKILFRYAVAGLMLFQISAERSDSDRQQKRGEA